MNSRHKVLGARSLGQPRSPQAALIRRAGAALALWGAGCVLVPTAAHAGSGTGHNAVFAQVFGSAGLLGAGYDHRWSALSARIGVASLPTFGLARDPVYLGAFGGLSGHVGHRHSLELGGEVTFLIDARTVGSFVFGYRYEPNSGFFFRGLGQLMIRSNDGAARLYPALSFGYSW